MTVRKAKEQLAQVIGYLHISEDSYTIKNGCLISKSGIMYIPIRNLTAIIPAHGSLMAVIRKRKANKVLSTSFKSN